MSRGSTPPLARCGSVTCGQDRKVPSARRRGNGPIDLRMITTCLSEGRPYGMPWDAHRFFYDPSLWRTLFPAAVVDALEAAPTTPPQGLGRPGEGTVDEESDELAVWRWEEQLAATHRPPLRRLPSGEHLPVIVATRMSLSFPLLISAVPLWVIDRRAESTKQTLVALREAVGAGAALPGSGLMFRQAWFTDGGFCSNFPVQMFDAAMPSRPTFAINLGRFSAGEEPVADERDNVRVGAQQQLGPAPVVQRTAHQGCRRRRRVRQRRPQHRPQLVRQHPTRPPRLSRPHRAHPPDQGRGRAQPVHGHGHIDAPGERGTAAGEVITEQFLEPRYPPSEPRATAGTITAGSATAPCSPPCRRGSTPTARAWPCSTSTPRHRRAIGCRRQGGSSPRGAGEARRARRHARQRRLTPSATSRRHLARSA